VTTSPTEDDTLAPPTALLKPYGLVAAVADWIDTRCHYKCRPLSVTAAIATVATVLGRRYALPSGLRSVLYLIGIAESGIGKEAGRQAAIRLLTRAGLEQRIGTGDFASETGMVVQMRDHPVRLFPLDEFGRMLAGFTSRSAGSHERQIVTTLLKLWSSGGSTFLGKAYAEKPAIRIEEPHAVLYATSTPQSFWRAVQGTDVVDGVLNRLLVVPVDGDRGAYHEVDRRTSEPPQMLIDTVKLIAKGPPMGDLSTVDSCERPGVHCVVELEASGEAASVKVRETADAWALKKPAQRDLWRRAHEQTLRLAMVAAVGQWPYALHLAGAHALAPPPAPTITEYDVLWAWGVVKWATRRMAAAVTDLVADGDEERAQLAIVKAARRAGEHGVSRSEVTLLLRHMPRRVREAALATALDSGQVVVEHRSSRRGPSAQWYRTPTSDEIEPDNLRTTAAE
jgi:hypothetical protein